MLALSQIPGLAEAVQREGFIRDAAFLGVNESIAGFEAVPLTLRRWLILRILRSPLIFGGTPTPLDLAQFLWVVNPAYNPASGGRKPTRRFFKQCRERFMPPEVFLFKTKRWKRKAARFAISAAEVLVSARQYVEDSFQDQPGGKPAGDQPPYFSSACTLCVSLAREYEEFNQRDVLDMPLKLAFQYQKLSEYRKTGIAFNPSDRVVNDFMAGGANN